MFILRLDLAVFCYRIDDCVIGSGTALYETIVERRKFRPFTFDNQGSNGVKATTIREKISEIREVKDVQFRQAVLVPVPQSKAQAERGCRRRSPACRPAASRSGQRPSQESGQGAARGHRAPSHAYVHRCQGPA